MTEQFHILNGDSLKEQFPENIKGRIIIARECLVDGNVKGRTLDELFDSRAKFISQHYGETEQGYYQKVVPEFHKIIAINGNSDINLWFEDDLFCQVNFWFVTNLLFKKDKSCRVFLVRPRTHTQYGFAGLKKSELISIYEDRMMLTDLDKISSLWESYQDNDTKTLLSTALQLKDNYPFILAAVNAHIERIPSNENMGRPTQSLIAIMKDIGTTEFGPVFREFNKKESIYGFGDLQVKRLYDEILNNR